jgi:hypothetical protein
MIIQDLHVEDEPSTTSVNGLSNKNNQPNYSTQDETSEMGNKMQNLLAFDLEQHQQHAAKLAH